MKINDLISKEIYKKRMSTCLECSSYQPKYKKCKECGCFLILKAALKITKCPLKKWED